MGDLLGGQGNARAQLEGGGGGDTRIHQGLVLLLVTGVVAQEAPAGEAGDLVSAFNRY